MRRPLLVVFISGLVAGLAVVVGAVFFSVVNPHPLPFEEYIGGLLLQRTGLFSAVIGALVLIAFHGLIALSHAATFKYVFRGASGPAIGVMTSLIHWIFVGFIVGWLSFLSGPVAPPGYFFLEWGNEPSSMTILLYVVYGLIVGSAHDWAYHKYSQARVSSLEARAVPKYKKAA